VLARAVDRALVNLRYGTVSVNAWPAVGYGLGAPVWGGAPGATLADAQSGLGWGHNALLLDSVHKVVLRAPLLAFPDPFWCPGHRRLRELGRAISEHEASPRPLTAARAAWAGLRR
jgi:aldehyde dehydrogenase (NAD(P)+)